MDSLTQLPTPVINHGHGQHDAPSAITSSDSPRTIRQKKEGWLAWAKRRLDEREAAEDIGQLEKVCAQQSAASISDMAVVATGKEEGNMMIVSTADSSAFNSWSPEDFLEAKAGPPPNAIPAEGYCRDFYMIICDELPYFFFDPLALAAHHAPLFRHGLRTLEENHSALVDLTIANPGKFVDWWVGSGFTSTASQSGSSENFDPAEATGQGNLHVGFASTMEDAKSLMKAIRFLPILESRNQLVIDELPISLIFSGHADKEGLQLQDGRIDSFFLEYQLPDRAEGRFSEITFFTNHEDELFQPISDGVHTRKKRAETWRPGQLLGHALHANRVHYQWGRYEDQLLKAASSFSKGHHHQAPTTGDADDNSHRIPTDPARLAVYEDHLLKSVLSQCSAWKHTLPLHVSRALTQWEFLYDTNKYTSHLRNDIHCIPLCPSLSLQKELEELAEAQQQQQSCPPLPSSQTSPPPILLQLPRHDDEWMESRKSALRQDFMRQIKEYYILDHPVPPVYELDYPEPDFVVGSGPSGAFDALSDGEPNANTASAQSSSAEQQHEGVAVKRKTRYSPLEDLGYGNIPFSCALLPERPRDPKLSPASVRILFFRANSDCIVVEELGVKKEEERRSIQAEAGGVVDSEVDQSHTEQTVIFRVVIDGGKGKSSDTLPHKPSFGSTAWKYLCGKKVDYVVSSDNHPERVSGLLHWIRDTPGLSVPDAIMMREQLNEKQGATLKRCDAQLLALRNIAKREDKLVNPRSIVSPSGLLRLRLVKPISEDYYTASEPKEGEGKEVTEQPALCFAVTYDNNKVALLPGGSNKIQDVIASLLGPYDFPVVQVPNNGLPDGQKLSEVSKFDQECHFVCTGLPRRAMKKKTGTDDEEEETEEGPSEEVRRATEKKKKVLLPEEQEALRRQEWLEQNPPELEVLNSYCRRKPLELGDEARKDRLLSNSYHSEASPTACFSENVWVTEYHDGAKKAAIHPDQACSDEARHVGLSFEFTAGGQLQSKKRINLPFGGLFTIV